MTAADLFAEPVELMLARTAAVVPTSAALPGGCVYEWKYDGYRLALQAPPAGGIRWWSRNGNNLSDVFPDLVAAAKEQVPPGVVLDGEAVVFVDGGLSFDHLQQRMAARAGGVAQLARQHPASYVVFDVLAVAGTDVRGLPWRDRRVLLEELAGGFTPPLQLSPYTANRAVAVGWLDELPGGIEGVVAKGRGSRYQPGVRGWVKTKAYRTSDAVVGAVIGSVTAPEAVVVGRYTGAGELRVVGRSTVLTTDQARQLAAALTAVPGAQHPWPAQIGAGHFGGDPVTITHVDPVVVVEIAADTARQAGRHRHAVRLTRLRLDLSPGDLDPLT